MGIKKELRFLKVTGNRVIKEAKQYRNYMYSNFYLTVCNQNYILLQQSKKKNLSL